MAGLKLRIFLGAAVLSAALLFTGCSSSGSSAGASYTVRPGDTLYSIAFNHGLDYQTLARLNGISAPYRIYVGQILNLGSQAAASGGDYVVRRGDTLSKIAAAHGSSVKTLAALNNLSAPYTLYVGQRLTLSGSGRQGGQTATAKAAPLPKTVSTSGQRTAAGLIWSWPADGRITAGYSRGDTGHPGVTIAGQRHQPVRAAADGQVVYAGNALRGYGNLLILTHASHYLTAYAHNETLQVREGERVKRGQTIATMGSTDTDRVELLFEIRYRGQTVDPLDYLPN